MPRLVLGVVGVLVFVACQQGEHGDTSGGAGSTTGTAVPVRTLAGKAFSVQDCQAYGDAGPFDPSSVAVDAKGTLYVASSNLDLVSSSGEISVFIPQSVLSPSVIAVAPTGKLLVSATIKIWSVFGDTPTLLAGGAFGCGDSADPGGVGFYSVEGIAGDSLGEVFVADRYPNQPPDGGRGCTRIRKIDSGGVTTTISGTGWQGFTDDSNGQNAQFNNPNGLAIDGSGNLYVADTGNNRIRKIAPGGATTTLAGNGNAGFDDGSGGPTGTATFNGPVSVAADAAGNVYVADLHNNSIRKVATDGTVTTVAGNGTPGDFDGTLGKGGTSTFSAPITVALAPNGEIYVGDYNNCSVRVITPQ